MKDKEYNYCTIKIKQIREVSKIGKLSTAYSDKMFCADIKFPTGARCMFCEKTLKKLFKTIKIELYL